MTMQATGCDATALYPFTADGAVDEKRLRELTNTRSPVAFVSFAVDDWRKRDHD